MLVGERMSRPVIHIVPEMPVSEALRLMQEEKIRRTPVVKKGEIVGIVSDKDLINATPSKATSLSVWELNYLLSKLTVKEVMTRSVITVSHDTPIEIAARIMVDNKIGGLPVMENSKMVGIITETDLFKLLLELMGAREAGVRATILMEDKPGQLAILTKAISDLDGNIIALGTFAGSDQSTREVTVKVTGIDKDRFHELLKANVREVLDIR